MYEKKKKKKKKRKKEKRGVKKDGDFPQRPAHLDSQNVRTALADDVVCELQVVVEVVLAL